MADRSTLRILVVDDDPLDLELMSVLVRQLMPIEMSSPFGFVMPLWHAMHRSAVWKCVPYVFG